MKLIEQSFEIKEQEPGLEGVLKQIEWAGRHCYKSEDKITEDSAKKFVDMLTTNCHGAMLEHGTVYLKVDKDHRFRDGAFTNFNEAFTDNLYYRMKADNNGTLYITTNYRYIIENKLEHWLKYQCEPTEYHEKRVTVKFTTDQGVMREFTRHRTMSFACESTRYCNYSKDKFGNELTFIIPTWLNLREGSYTYDFPNGFTYNGYKLKGDSEFNAFLISLARIENTYLNLIENQGWKPQQARNILPLATKCDLIMTGFVSDWKHFFSLRADSAAHPQAQELVTPLQAQFKENGYI